jgi:hypothetical protein
LVSFQRERSLASAAADDRPNLLRLPAVLVEIIGGGGGSRPTL